MVNQLITNFSQRCVFFLPKSPNKFYLFEWNVERIEFSGLCSYFIHVTRAREEIVAILKENGKSWC